MLRCCDAEHRTEVADADARGRPGADRQGARAPRRRRAQRHRRRNPHRDRWPSCAPSSTRCPKPCSCSIPTAASGSANPAVDRLFPGRPVADHRDLMSRFEPLPIGSPTEGTLLVRPTRMPNRWYELRSVPLGRVGAGTGSGRILLLRDVTEPHRGIAPSAAPTSRSSRTSSGRRSRRSTPAAASCRRRVRRGVAATGPARGRHQRRGGAALRPRRGPPRPDARRARACSSCPTSRCRCRASSSRRSARSAAVRPSVPIIVAGATDPPAVRGDADYVEHALRNLIASAVAFGGPGAPIIVRIEPGAGEVAVLVLDRRPDATPAHLSMSFALVDEPTAPRRLGLGIPLFVVPPPHRGDGRPGLGATPSRRRRRAGLRPAGLRVRRPTEPTTAPGSGGSSPRPGPGVARGGGRPPAPPPA